MTASKVISAVPVDMCRRQQPIRPGGALAALVAAGAPPTMTVVDLMRSTQPRRRNNARVCLFGAPEPGATRVLYDKMLSQQHDYMLQRYEFDTHTDRYVGADVGLRRAQAQQEAQTVAAMATAADEASRNDLLQQRLHGNAADPAAEAADSDNDAPASDEATASYSTANANERALAVAAAANTTTCGTSSSVGAKLKPNKTTAAMRQTKPYDRPASVRPITDFFRKSKKPCPTATVAAVAKLQSTTSSVPSSSSSTQPSSSSTVDDHQQA